jgi:hypothetical protein
MVSSVALVSSLLLGAAPPGQSPPFAWLAPEALAGDLANLKQAGLSAQSPDLLGYVRKRTLTPALRARAQKLIGDLAADEFSVREKANADLRELGPGIVPVLRPFANSRDLEQRRRVQRLLSRLEPAFDSGQVAAVARLLAARGVPGGTSVLLAYLPDAVNQSEIEQLREALAFLSCPGGKPDREIIAALADAETRRRAVAAFAVGRSGSKGHLAAVRKRLADRAADVRAGAALGLALAGDSKAVAVLIELTGQLSGDERVAVEDALGRLAGDAAPDTPGGDNPEDAKKRRDLWLAWWAGNRTKIDLRRLHREGMLGYTLCVLFEGSVRVTELGRDNKPLWAIKGLSNAVDAHIIGGNRILIAEHGVNRVAEWTFGGKVVWEHKVAQPIRAQRLGNDNTFITTMSAVMEIDRKGNEVFARKDLGPLRAAWKYGDGRFAVVTRERIYRRFDATGKEEKKYTVALQISNGIGGVDFLPDGGLLAVNGNGVIQYDPSGKKVWEAKGLTSPYCPTRLRNGHTLVACTGTQRFVEFDRAGRIVRTVPVKGTTPWVARRR